MSDSFNKTSRDHIFFILNAVFIPRCLVKAVQDDISVISSSVNMAFINEDSLDQIYGKPIFLDFIFTFTKKLRKTY